MKTLTLMKTIIITIFKNKLSQREVVFFVVEALFIALFSCIVFSYEIVEKWKDYFQNVNIALLTILIPLAIAVLSDYLRDKRSKNGKVDYLELDLQIILNNVFNIKKLLFVAILLFLPSFFWTSILMVKVFWTIIWLIGVFLLVMIILDFFFWIKSPYIFRYSYLSKVRKNNEYIKAWFSVWAKNDMRRNEEEEFFDIFSSKISSLIKEDEPNLFFNSLFSSFTQNIKNRSKDMLLYGGKSVRPFEKILRWHRTDCKMGQTKRFPIAPEIEEVISYLETESFSSSYCHFFSQFKNHIDKYLDDKYYVDSLFSRFFSVLLSNLDKINGNLSPWRCYPEEWKIKSANIGKENIIPIISLVKVLEFAENRIPAGRFKGDNYDRQLEYIFSNLFSETEHIEWSNLIIFLLYPESENKLEEIITSNRPFGRFGKMMGGWFETDDKFNEEVQEKIDKGLAENKKLIKIVYKINKYRFPEKEQLINYREEIKILKDKYVGNRNVMGRITETERVLEILTDIES